MPSAKTKFVCAALSFRRLRGTSAYPPRLAVKADIPDRQVRARKRHMHRSKTASSFDQAVHAGEPEPFAERNLWNARGVRLLRLNVGCSDYLGPLLGIVGNELAKFS